MEQLQVRRLFALEAEFFVDTIYVYATDNADVVEIFNDGNQIVVNSDSASSWFAPVPPADVARIIVWAYEGNDFVIVEPSITAAVNIYGDAGNDTLTGGSGNDYLSGGLGGDVLSGGPGNDRLYGNNDNDTLKADAGSDTLDGGSSIDLADYGARAASLSISLDNLANDGSAGEGDNVKDNVEDIKGGYGDDVLTGSSVSNHIWGSYGKDRIFGLGGDDYMFGGYHDDTLDGGTGSDIFTGDQGSDTADYSLRTAMLTIDIDAGFDDGEVGEADMVGATMENVIGGAASDRITGSDANNRLQGRGGKDTLSGGAGNDTLDGGNDGIADKLIGGGGADTFITINRNEFVTDFLAADGDVMV